MPTLTFTLTESRGLPEGAIDAVSQSVAATIRRVQGDADDGYDGRTLNAESVVNWLRGLSGMTLAGPGNDSFPDEASYVVKVYAPNPPAPATPATRFEVGVWVDPNGRAHVRVEASRPRLVPKGESWVNVVTANVGVGAVYPVLAEHPGDRTFAMLDGDARRLYDLIADEAILCAGTRMALADCLCDQAGLPPYQRQRLNAQQLKAVDLLCRLERPGEFNAPPAEEEDCEDDAA